MTLVSIHLTQFGKDYQNCTYIQGLISLSSDFFQKKAVLNGTLFLESNDHNKALTLLNEASGVDFDYTVYKTGNIEIVKAILKSV